MKNSVNSEHLFRHFRRVLRTACLWAILIAGALPAPAQAQDPDLRRSIIPTLFKGNDRFDGAGNGYTVDEPESTSWFCDYYPSIYYSFAGSNWTTMEFAPGGFNAVGGFSNQDVLPNPLVDNRFHSESFGIELPFEWLRLRIEWERQQGRDPHQIVTGSFPGPPGPHTFFYRTQLGNIETEMVNVWFGVPITERLEVYGGFGSGRMTIDQVSTFDFVVFGQVQNVEMSARQWGFGVVYRLGQCAALDVGWRKMYLGGFNIPITAGGTLSFDVEEETAALISLRIHSPGILINRLTGKSPVNVDRWELSDGSPSTGRFSSRMPWARR